MIAGAPGASERTSGFLLHHQACTIDTQLSVFKEITCDQAVLSDPVTAPTQIARLLRGQAFDPETVQAVTNALVMTFEALGLSNRDDAMTQLVAEKIIEFAKRGLKNPSALHLAAIKEFG